MSSLWLVVMPTLLLGMQREELLKGIGSQGFYVTYKKDELKEKIIIYWCETAGTISNNFKPWVSISKKNYAVDLYFYNSINKYNNSSYKGSYKRIKIDECQDDIEKNVIEVSKRLRGLPHTQVNVRSTKQVLFRGDIDNQDACNKFEAYKIYYMHNQLLKTVHEELFHKYEKQKDGRLLKK